MTQEEKSILLQDLSARLPYGVVVTHKLNVDNVHGVMSDIDMYGNAYIRHYGINKVDFIKPYLRPMSSMTEEEIEEAKTNGCIIYHDTSPKNRGLMVIASPKGFDWLNKKMFAYRTIDGKDMFELGLAIEAPEGMYNTK